ncbi:hypothetical protein, partial [uncultured Methylobacterium sp.]|uniref:hypothetical protein n=1 Tax=uncultured Methylobacterium sp. TaxID=157278 RepID=UPI002594E411
MKLIFSFDTWFLLKDTEDRLGADLRLSTDFDACPRDVETIIVGSRGALSSTAAERRMRMKVRRLPRSRLKSP